MLFKDEGKEPPKAAGAHPERLGDFRIERELGRGGMGVVYLAVQESLGRKVAVKVLPLGAVPMADAVERFHREASVVSKLAHEHIVPIYAMGQEAGCLYYAMELVEGETLRDRVARGPLAPRDAAEIARGIARALHHAHEAGAVHRDVKPGNILIDGRGKARLADFGLVRVAGAQTLTTGGDILGTPAYMSPEQAFGDRTLDARSDVYSLGAVLYEALAGQPPVDLQASVFVQLAAVRALEPPTLTRLNSRIPRDLEVIVGHAMAKERERRYPTAAALADDLERWLHGEAIQARPPSLAFRATRLVQRHRAAVAAGAFALLVLAVAAVYGLTRPGTLTLDVQPEDALVSIDGAPARAAAEERRFRLAAGPHRLRVEREGYTPVDMAYPIGRGESATIPITLRRIQQQVTIETEPPECVLTFVPREGRPFRLLSPLAGEWIDTGEYELVVERNGYYRRRFPLVVPRERPVAERVYLPSATIWKVLENQRAAPVTTRVPPDGETAVALCVETGSIDLLRGRDGSRVARISSATEFPRIAVVDADGDEAPEILITGTYGECELFRATDGTEVWRRPTPVAAARSLLSWTPAGQGTDDLWLVREGGLENVDLRTGVAGPATRGTWGALAGLGGLGRGRYYLLLPDRAEIYRFPAERLGGGPIPPLSESHRSAVVDLDSDGDEELLLAHSDGTVRAYRTEPFALLWATEPLGTDRPIFAVGRLREGERPSTVGFLGDSTVVWDADGRERSRFGLPAPSLTWMCLADVNADGDRDLVYTSSDAAWVIDLESGGVLAEVPGVPGAGYGALADLDDDGLLDMIFSVTGGTVLAIPGPKVLWEYAAGAAIRRPPALVDLTEDGLPDVVASSLDHHVYAWDGRTGRVLWKVSMEEQAATMPAIVGTDVIAAAWGGLARRIRGRTGDVLWTYRPQVEGWRVNFHASPAAADADGDGRVEIFLADWRESTQQANLFRGAVHCVEFDSGRVRWVAELGAQFATAPVVLPGGRVLVGDVRGGLFLLDARDGSLLRREEVDGEFRSEAVPVPAEAEGRPFLAWTLARSGALLRIDPADGRAQPLGLARYVLGATWVRDGGRWLAILTAVSDRWSGDEPVLMEVRAVGWPGGEERWRWESAAPIFTESAAADLDGDGAAEVIVVDKQGEVTCLRAATGERVWRFGAGAEVESAPRIADLDGDGAAEVLLGAKDGRMLVLRGRGRRWTNEWSTSLGDFPQTGAPASVGP